MKHARALWLIATGTLVFAIGLFVPLTYYFLHTSLLIAGAAIVFLFYLTILVEVIRSKKLSLSQRTFWLIAIICVPVVGNVIYMLFQDLANQKQSPHLQNF